LLLQLSKAAAAQDDYPMAPKLVPEHRRNLILETAISIVFNTLISGLFAWAIFHEVDYLPLWGAQGIVVDLIPTVFMITLVLTLILTLITRARVRKKRLPAPQWSRNHLNGFGWLPANLAIRAPVLALALTAILVPLSALLLVALGVEGMNYSAFFKFKLVYGALFALVVTPIILLRALADLSVLEQS
jgi:hypothetical protein